MPLPPSTTELVSSARRHLTDLTDFQIPRLATSQGPLSLQQNIAAELREDIETFARQVETLELSIGDLSGERSRREVQVVVEELKEALGRIRQDARAALLASKRAIDSQRKSQRDELLASSAVSEKQTDPNEKVTDDALMKANADVTDALRRTIGLMQNELERSVLTVQMLDSSTATLRSTSSTHSTLNNVLTTSKHLVTALEKTDWLDRVIILSAFAFFVLVVLFIVKERLLDRGFRIAFWWTRFLPDFSGDEALLAGAGAGAGVKQVLGSGVASASVVVASAATSLVTVVSSSASLAPSVAASEAQGEAEEELETTLVELVGSLTNSAVFDSVGPTTVVESHAVHGGDDGTTSAVVSEDIVQTTTTTTTRTSDSEHSTERVVDEL